MFRKILVSTKGRLKGLLGLWSRKCILARTRSQYQIQRAEWALSLEQPRKFYEQVLSYYENVLPHEIKEHRRYFTRNRRGFGEDAFHTLWYLLVKEFKIQNFLEIGVYRGQTLSLISLLQRHMKIEGAVFGVSPFLPAGDEVSTYMSGIDYYEDTLTNFRKFNLPSPNLVKAFSTDAEAALVIASKEWDCIYIDGNHDYEVALSDWNICCKAVRQGGLIVLDDSGLTTLYRPPLFATGGHPGPSRVAEEIDRSLFKEILQVGHNRVFQKIKDFR